MRCTMCLSFVLLVGCGGTDDPVDPYGFGAKGEDGVIDLGEAPRDTKPTEFIVLVDGETRIVTMEAGKNYVLQLQGHIDNPQLRWWSMVPLDPAATVVTHDGDLYTQERITVPAHPGLWDAIVKRQSDGCYLDSAGEVIASKPCLPGIYLMGCSFSAQTLPLAPPPLRPASEVFAPPSSSLCEAVGFACQRGDVCAGQSDHWKYELRCEAETDGCNYGKGFNFRQCTPTGSTCAGATAWQFCGFPGGSTTPAWHECATPTMDEQKFIAMMFDKTVDDLFRCAPHQPSGLRIVPTVTTLTTASLQGSGTVNVAISANKAVCTPDALTSNQLCANYVSARKDNYPDEYQRLQQGKMCQLTAP